jgi:hypothetical protein
MALRGSALETSIMAALLAIFGVTAYRWWIFRGRPIAFGSATLLVWLAYYAAAFGSALAFDYFSRRSTPAPPAKRSPSGSRGAPGIPPPVRRREAASRKAT